MFISCKTLSIVFTSIFHVICSQTAMIQKYAQDPGPGKWQSSRAGFRLGQTGSRPLYSLGHEAGGVGGRIMSFGQRE